MENQEFQELMLQQMSVITRELSDNRKFQQTVIKELADLRAGQEEMRGDIAELRAGQEEMRGDIAEMRGDIAELRAGQEELRVSQIELQKGQAEIRNYMYGMENRLTQKIDAVATDVGKVLTSITDEAGAEIDKYKRKLELIKGNE